MSLFDPGPTVLGDEQGPNLSDLSADARRTYRWRMILASGKHPATGLPLRGEGTCGECAHAHRYLYHDRHFWKCDKHRLGESHSPASDVRVGWPACTLFDPRPEEPCPPPTP